MRLERNMKALCGTILSLAVAMGGPLCPAQNAKIPFKQIQRDVQLSASAAAPANEAAVARESLMPSESTSSSAVFLSRPPKAHRTIGKRFLLLNGLHLGLAVLDVELTQHCIANRHCVEQNPLMPSSHAGQLSINFALVGLGTFTSYKLKKQDTKMWILSPTVGIGAHTIGAATGIAHW
jgi:hypothetical protein